MHVNTLSCGSGLHVTSNALEHVIRRLYTGQANSLAFIIYIATLTTNYIVEIQETYNLRVLSYLLSIHRYASYPTDVNCTSKQQTSNSTKGIVMFESQIPLLQLRNNIILPTKYYNLILGWVWPLGIMIAMVHCSLRLQDWLSHHWERVTLWLQGLDQHRT